jgi:hypothetical protein
MPIRVHDARRLSDPRGDQIQLLRSQSDDIYLNVKRVVRPEFSDDSTRQTIQILKTFQNARNCARIRVSDDTQPTQGKHWKTHRTHPS